MIKNFEEYINEDYFSKLANRKDNNKVRKENEITEELVRSYMYEGSGDGIKSILLRKENGKTVVDIDGDFAFREDIEEIPFQFGTVTGCFNCSHCEKLTSLEGCPKRIGGFFNCSYCTNLTSLEGCPKEVDGHFFCHSCGKQFMWEDVKSLCNIKGNIYNDKEF